MPWTEQSPLGAAIGVASGFLQGQQQAKQQALENQRLALQQALEQRRQQSEEAYQQFDMNDRARARDISEGKDPDTGKLITAEMPAQLQVGVSPKASLQAQYDKNMKVAMFFLSRGFKEQASPYLDAAQQNAAQMNAQQTFARDFAKAIVIANLTTGRELAGINAREGAEDRRESVRLQTEVSLHGAPTYADLHPKPGAAGRGPRVPTFANVDTELQEWAQGSQTQGVDPNTKATVYNRVPPDPRAKNYVYSAVTQIQASPNPLRAAAQAQAAFKKTFGNDAQALKILNDAGQNAASPPAPPHAP